MAHSLERAYHQARGDEQHDGQRNLRDHQRIPGAVALTAVAREPSPFLQRRCEPRLRVLQHGKQAEEQPRAERESEGEEQDDRIDPDFLDARQALRGARDEQAHATPREQQADDAAEKPKRDALGQQLPRDAARAGSERGVNRQLLLTPFRADQKQIRHVGARDEQDEADGAEQHPQDAANIADDVLRERPHVRPEPSPHRTSVA